jgi:hypothetical protein
MPSAHGFNPYREKKPSLRADRRVEDSDKPHNRGYLR